MSRLDRLLFSQRHTRVLALYFDIGMRYIGTQGERERENRDGRLWVEVDG